MAKNTIILKNYLNIFEEIEAGGTIKPGMLIMLNSDNKVVVHTGGDVLPMFAVEDALQGKTIDDNYTNGQPVQCWIPQRGDQVYAVLQDGEDVSIGDFLSSNGNGRLAKHESESETDVGISYKEPIVAVALEALDLSTSESYWPDTARRIKVRII